MGRIISSLGSFKKSMFNSTLASGIFVCIKPACLELSNNVGKLQNEGSQLIVSCAYKATALSITKLTGNQNGNILMI
jgi:hypothetical protein